MPFNAQSAMRSVVGIIVGILVSAILIGALLPVAIEFIMNTDTTNWGTAEQTLFNLFPLLFVLVPFIAVVAWVYKVM